MSYFPPFRAQYCERFETPPWDGCVFRSTARAIDAITGGAITPTEDELRAIVGNPDRPGQVDGATIGQAIDAIRAKCPKAVIRRATGPDDLTAWLRAGGAAVCIGPANRMPSAERVYDPSYYDSGGGHGVYVQGLDGKEAWGNPERFWSPLLYDAEYPLGAGAHMVFPLATYGGAVLLTPAAEAAEMGIDLARLEVLPYLTDVPTSAGASVYDLLADGTNAPKLLGTSIDSTDGVGVKVQSKRTPPAPGAWTEMVGGLWSVRKTDGTTGLVDGWGGSDHVKFPAPITQIQLEAATKAAKAATKAACVAAVQGV